MIYNHSYSLQRIKNFWQNRLACGKEYHYHILDLHYELCENIRIHITSSYRTPGLNVIGEHNNQYIGRLGNVLQYIENDMYYFGLEERFNDIKSFLDYCIINRGNCCIYNIYTIIYLANKLKIKRASSEYNW